MTPTQLETEVLLELQVVAVGDTPDSEDSESVGDDYTRFHAYLASENVRLAYWNADDSIPDEAADSVVALVANRMAVQFGRNAQQIAVHEWKAVNPQNPNSALAKLKVLARGAPSALGGTPASTEATSY